MNTYLKRAILILGVLWLCQSSFAEQKDSIIDKKALETMMIKMDNQYIEDNVLKMNLWSIVVAGVDLTYERRITNFLTLQTGVNYFYRYFYEPMQVFRLNLQCRIYPAYRLRHAPKGFYIGFSAGYAAAYGHYGNYSGYRWDDPVFDDLKDRWYHSPEIGLRTGCQIVVRSGFVLDLGLGWSAFPTAGKFPGSNTDAKDYLIPVLITSMGFNF